MEWDENWAFEGNSDNLKLRLSGVQEYYVYALCRPSGEPFYVGKGKGQRVLHHVNEARQGKRLFQNNPHKNNVIRKIHESGSEVLYRLAKEFDDEQQSYDYEHMLIEHYKRVCDGGCLTNLDPGLGSARGRAPFSKQRHSKTLAGAPDDNPQRATLNLYLQSIGKVESVPVKPIDQLKIQHSVAHTQARSPSLRCAYALVASAAANNLILQNGVRIPRKFEYNGVFGIIENGVCRDILKAKMAELKPTQNPADEIFELNEKQITILKSIYGASKLEAMALLF